MFPSVGERTWMVNGLREGEKGKGSKKRERR